MTPDDEQLERCAFKKVDLGDGFVEITIRMPFDDAAPELLYGNAAIQRIHLHILGGAAGLCRAAGVDASLVFKDVLIALGAQTPGGTCRLCGCTDACACVGGCAWVNDEHTLCSACVGD